MTSQTARRAPGEGASAEDLGAGRGSWAGVLWAGVLWAGGALSELEGGRKAHLPL